MATSAIKMCSLNCRLRRRLGPLGWIVQMSAASGKETEPAAICQAICIFCERRGSCSRNQTSPGAETPVNENEFICMEYAKESRRQMNSPAAVAPAFSSLWVSCEITEAAFLWAVKNESVKRQKKNKKTEEDASSKGDLRLTKRHAEVGNNKV